MIKLYYQHNLIEAWHESRL